jgi:hypothetical protein
VREDRRVCVKQIVKIIKVVSLVYCNENEEEDDEDDDEEEEERKRGEEEKEEDEEDDEEDDEEPVWTASACDCDRDS